MRALRIIGDDIFCVCSRCLVQVHLHKGVTILEHLSPAIVGHTGLGALGLGLGLSSGRGHLGRSWALMLQLGARQVALAAVMAAHLVGLGGADFDNHFY
jgi:hypothetical protein